MIVKKKILFLILIPAVVGEYLFGMAVSEDRLRTPSPGLLGSELERYKAYGYLLTQRKQEQEKQEELRRILILAQNKTREKLGKEIEKVVQGREQGMSLRQVLKNIKLENIKRAEKASAAVVSAPVASARQPESQNRSRDNRFPEDIVGFFEE